MSWGKDPKKWGKQVAVRFTAVELSALDRLVATKNGDRNSPSWWSRGWQPKATRSSVIVELVRKADGPQLASDTARAPSDASSSPAHELPASDAGPEDDVGEAAIAASDSRRRPSDATRARGASNAASDATRSRRVRRSAAALKKTSTTKARGK